MAKQMDEQMEYLMEEEMGAKMPWFPFYTADFWKDEAVQLMNYSQIGMYVRLLSLDWDEGSIPADWKLVAKLLRLTEPERADFEEMVTWIEPKYTDAEAASPVPRRTHKKVKVIRERQRDIREKRIKAAQKGGKRAAKAKQAARQKAEQTDEQMAEHVAEQTERHEERHTGEQNSTKSESKSDLEDKEGSEPEADSPPPPDLPQGDSYETIWFEGPAMHWTTEYEVKLQNDYPGLRVRQEMIKARNWNDSQPPSNRKKAAKKFMIRWLNREVAKVERLKKFTGGGGGGRHGTALRNSDANVERQRRLDEQDKRKRIQPGVDIPGGGLS